MEFQLEFYFLQPLSMHFSLNQKAHADSQLSNCSKYFPSDHDFESSTEVDSKFSKLNFNPNTHAISLFPYCKFASIVSLTFPLFHFTRHDINSCSTGYWIFGAEFCDTWIAFDVMCSTSSILNLCAISLDRYIHIKDPLR